MNDIKLILGFILMLLILYLLIKISSTFRKKIYGLFLFAENNIVKGKKMNYVVNTFCSYLPFPLNCLPKTFYRALLQSMFDEIHDLLDDGKKNKSNKRVK